MRNVTLTRNIKVWPWAKPYLPVTTMKFKEEIKEEIQ